MFTIGADPEMFLKNMDTGVLVPCIGILGGTKDEPIPVVNGAIQEDNVMAEFNIDAADNEKAFIHNILSVRKQIRDRLKRYNLTEHIAGSAHFPTDLLLHPQAQTFGCDPDFNAWTGKQNTRPECDDKTLRTAGGHIHVGAEIALKHREQTIQYMDLYIGVPSIIFDLDTERRKLYGKAGAFRPKPYGVEYRTVSNFWIETPAKIKWVYKQVGTALQETSRATSYRTSEGLSEVTRELVQRAINTSDKNLAAYLIDVHNINLKGLV